MAAVKMTPAALSPARCPLPSDNAQALTDDDSSGTPRRADHRFPSGAARHLDARAGRTRGGLMMSASIAYGIAALLIAWAMLRFRDRPAYSCPTCGTRRADGHGPECPWRSRP